MLKESATGIRVQRCEGGDKIIGREGREKKGKVKEKLKGGIKNRKQEVDEVVESTARGADPYIY